MKIIIILITLFFVSCAKSLYIPIERTRTITETLHDTVIITKLEHETQSQILRDTTSTVQTKYAISTAVWHGAVGQLEHNIMTKDTPFEVRVQYVERVVVDSIPVPYSVEVEKIVEKPTRMPLRWWERWLVWIGAGTLLFLFMLLLFRFVKIRK